MNSVDTKTNYTTLEGKGYRFQDADYTSYGLGLFSALAFLIGLYVFGYYFNYKDNKFETKDSGKNYSISNQLSSGNQVGMLISFSLGYVLLVALITYRFVRVGKWLAYFIPLIIIITSVFALLISMVIYSPFKKDGSKWEADDLEHGIVATVAFTLALVFNIFINTLIILNNRKFMVWLIILSLLEVGAFAGLFSDAYYGYEHRYTDSDNNDSQDLFDSLENVNYCFIVVTVLLLAFFRTPSGY